MYEIFERLLKERGMTAYQFSKETGIGSSTLSEWKKGKHQLKGDKLQVIAAFFGVSVDYLLTGKESPKESTDGTIYYFNDDAAQLAQELMDNKELRILMDASRDLTPENVAALAALAKQLKGTNPNG